MGSRPFHGGASLRKTPRITNKTRLKLHRDELDLDFIPDDEEESARLSQQTQGVDQEDSKEVHLLQALSRHDPRSGGASSVQAFIPIPDNTGVADNYDTLYPPKKWKDPITYLCTSTTVEESITDAIADGLTYYLDERDADWLNRNNEAARGEGTSAQGAISANARTSVRNTKGKGKEDASVLITENEFELVMGAFEWVTQQNTEFLHIGLQNGMPFPGFAEYQTFFSAPLPRKLFASYLVPAWAPPPPQLLKVARAIYPHWRHRREERGGHRIIPSLNYDESDVSNESYVCFRRRDTKAVRKTRAQQSSSSEKLARLQADLAAPIGIARALYQRETPRGTRRKPRNCCSPSRRFPTLGDKDDEANYLVDKERVVRKHADSGRTPLAKLRAPADPSNVSGKSADVAIKPQERLTSPYQQPSATWGRRWYPTDGSRRSDRYGRGGRLLVDRRSTAVRRIDASARRSAIFPDIGLSSLASTSQSTLFGSITEVQDEQPDADDSGETSDDSRSQAPSPPVAIPDAETPDDRLLAQWAFDVDDTPAVGPEGLEEQDRILLDDFSSRYELKFTSSIFHEADVMNLGTHAAFHYMNAEGREVERPLLFMPALRPQIRDPRIMQQAMLARRAGAAQAQQAAQPPVVTAQPVGMQTVVTGTQKNGQGLAAAPAPPMAQQAATPQPGAQPPHVAVPHHQRARPPPIQLPSNVLAAPRPASTNPAPAQVPTVSQQQSPPNASAPIAAPRPQAIPIPHVDNHVGGGLPTIQRIPSQQQQHASLPNANGSRLSGAVQHATGSQPHTNGVQHQRTGSAANGYTPDMMAAYAYMQANGQFNRRLPPSYMHLAAANFPKMAPGQWAHASPQVNGMHAARPAQQPHSVSP
ncbi:enhancer of polycomb-like-domain-containing protein, partial [Schizophyllum amplum]